MSALAHPKPSTAIFKNSALAKVCSLMLKLRILVLELMQGLFLQWQYAESP